MANATKTTPRLKIRRGDLVEVLSGKDVGRRGKVLEVIPTRIAGCSSRTSTWSSATPNRVPSRARAARR